MKSTLKNFKERLRRPASTKQLTILWILLGLSFLADYLNVMFLSRQYNCTPKELLYVSGFYWLSPLFGLVDLIIGYIIFKKTIVYINLYVHDFVFNGNYNKPLRIVIPKIIKYDYHSISKMLSIIIMAISILSLASDIVKIFK